MPNLLLIFIVLIIITVGSELIISTSITNKLTTYIFNSENEKYIKLRNKKLTTTFLPVFNLFYLDLSKAIKDKDIDGAKEILNSLTKIKLNKRQKTSVYTRAFYFYLSINENDIASKYYHALKKNEIDTDFNIEVSYDVFINKGYKYIDELEDLFNKSNDLEKVRIASILCNAYENKQDKKNQNIYLKYIDKKMNELTKWRTEL